MMIIQQNDTWYQMYELSVRGELEGRVLHKVVRVTSEQLNFSLFIWLILAEGFFLIDF